MTESRNDDLIFVYLGTVDYHFMIQKNIKLLRLLYPDSRVIVYDWGDAARHYGISRRHGGHRLDRTAQGYLVPWGYLR